MAHRPLKFFDALLDLDPNGRFEPFSDDQVAILERFSELCTEMAQTAFFRGPVHMAFKASPQENYERLDHAGEDQLRAMTMRFRQLWMQREPTRFHNVLAIMRRGAAPASQAETTTFLDELGRRHRRARRVSLMMHVWADDPMGDPIREFDAEQVIDDWFNGGQLHSDADAMRRVRSWSATGYEWSLIKAIRGVASVVWELDIVVAAALDARSSSPVASGA